MLQMNCNWHSECVHVPMWPLVSVFLVFGVVLSVIGDVLVGNSFVANVDRKCDSMVTFDHSIVGTSENEHSHWHMWNRLVVHTVSTRDQYLTVQHVQLSFGSVDT